MFNNKWFIKHQKKLLKFANSFIGRHILRIYGKSSDVGKNKILRILPNSITWKEGKYYKAEFRTHDKFGKRLFYAFYPVWYLFHLWDILFANNFKPEYNLGFDTLTVYPDAGDPAAAAVDGRVFYDAHDVAWATMRGATAGDGVQSTTDSTQFWYIKCSATTNQWASLYHGFALFNTAALTASANISAAVLSFWGLEVVTTLGSQTAGIVASNPASNTTLVTGDFDTLSYTDFCTRIGIASFATGSYQAFTLNASGITAVSKTGISKYGMTVGADIDNTPPTWSSSAVSYVTHYTADRTGTDNDPKLVVTYTLPVNANKFIESDGILSNG